MSGYDGERTHMQRNLYAGAEAEIAEEHYLLACSLEFLHSPEATHTDGTVHSD